MAPEVFEIPLSGPVYERAVTLAKEAVTAILHGEGPSGLFALEPILTEMANDRRMGGTAALVLASLAANASLVASVLELDLPEEEGRSPAAIEAADALIADLADAAGSAGPDLTTP